MKKVSYSQFSLYLNCPKRWKLDYVDGLRTYDQNINTCFGSAFHNTLQNYLTVLFNESAKVADEINLGDYLKQAIFDEYKDSLTKNGNVHYSTPEQLSEFYLDGEAILKYFQRHRRAYFTTKKHSLIGIEVPLKSPLGKNIEFIGFIDIAIKNEETGRIKIYDIKTSTMGWNKYQKADTSKTAQMILYKEFYARQFNVDPEMIDVEYIIVRRKINDNLDFPPKRIQTFIPASGKPTRNKINRMFNEFLDNCFTDQGEYNLESHYPAVVTSACKYCPYANEDSICPKSERIKQ